MRWPGPLWRQVKLGNNAFYGVNYLQSVTPTLALGGEAFWLGSQRKSGVGFAARHASENCVATAQVSRRSAVWLRMRRKQRTRPLERVVLV
jgi:mitochondrial import receptor subunit TOM40